MGSLGAAAGLTDADLSDDDLTDADLTDDLLAHRLATEAGELLLRLRAQATTQAPAEMTDAERAALKDQGDRASHEFLVAAIKMARPDDAILSEEGQAVAGERTAAPDQTATGARVATPNQTSAGRIWIIDPLDGTREFGEPPRDDWAVHVALVCDHQPVAGAVALPARGITLSTAAPLAAPHATDLGASEPSAPTIIASRSRPGPVPQALVSALGGQLVLMGSAGVKASEVILGHADIYAHSGGQYEWDSAAPIAVARAVGLHTSRLDGSPLRYNQPNPYLPDLLICRPQWAAQVIEIAAQVAE